ncbi:MAG: amidohydrolase family protein, partial [Nocardioidaceae bacterium]|nr:amidohydrolase family protein [Nocardioidaceae bacterium]
MRSARAFDGARFLDSGATVLVEGRSIVGVEPFGYAVPAGCSVTTYDGTLLPGLVDAHVHLCTDSGDMALDRVAGYSGAELDAVVTEALARHLASGVTTVRDLGDRRYHVVSRRDAQHDRSEPRIVAAGPPVTVPDGHLHYCGGAVTGPEEIRAAVRERVDRRVDVVKVMASGGMTTMGTDVAAPQFSLDDLRLLVDEAHAAGLPVAAHAHAAVAIDLAVEVGVDSIEHASYVVRSASGGAGTAATDAQLEALGASGIAVCPTFGGFTVESFARFPEPMLARLREFGRTPEAIVEERMLLTRRMAEAGVRFVSGTDAGISPHKAHGRFAEAVIELGSVTGSAAALATATGVAADVCGLSGVTGRLAAGHDADLLAVR